MSTFNPRPPYSQDELAALYPNGLSLRQVQVLLRHGERTPVSPRFQNAGVPPYWPYCQAANRFVAAVFSSGGKWDQLSFQRQMETFGPDGEAVIARGPRGETSNVCLQGELTDKGRETTLALGQRLRHLYIDQLGFLGGKLETTSHFYLRATPIVRALESLQQVFTGLYPYDARAPGLHPPTIVSRTAADENLYPNDANCRRFLQLSRAFANFAAHKWNDSEDMKYLTKKIGSYVGNNGVVAVNGRPRLSGVMDSISATHAHGPETKLPKVFYEEEVRNKIEKINVEEWFLGYEESLEYRRLGVGSLLGDIRDRMVHAIDGTHPATEVISGKAPKMALMGCHDTTLGGILASLGAFDHRWPPFTSHIAFELFSSTTKAEEILPISSSQSSSGPSLLERLGLAKRKEPQHSQKNLSGWYVRLRYNDKPIVVKGCKPEGKHLDGDESFCTLEAFNEVVGKMTPKNWKAECSSSLDAPVLRVIEPVE